MGVLPPSRRSASQGIWHNWQWWSKGVTGRRGGPRWTVMYLNSAEESQETRLCQRVWKNKTTSAVKSPHDQYTKHLPARRPQAEHKNSTTLTPIPKPPLPVSSLHGKSNGVTFPRTVVLCSAYHGRNWWTEALTNSPTRGHFSGGRRYDVRTSVRRYDVRTSSSILRAEDLPLCVWWPHLKKTPFTRRRGVNK